MDNEKFTVEFGEVTNIGGGGTSDFDELTNRPKYNDTTMSSDTNIPKVPAKTSDLTNDGSDGESTYVEADVLAKVATSGSYADLENKPSIPTVNDATLTITQNGTSKGTFTANDADDTTIEVSDTTYSNFTGTDGTAAGAAGLVPAPATTDADKFLKADGTWDSAGGGDTVYSTKNTSNSANGGAVYIGGKDATQQINLDPSADNHRKYFWALPYNTGDTGQTIIPGNETINIGAEQGGINSENNVSVGYRGRCTGNQNVNIGWQTLSDRAGDGHCVTIGGSAECQSGYGTALGSDARVNQNHPGSVALGTDSRTTRAGEVYIGPNNTYFGYNNTKYRVIGGVHDPVDAHDAATKGYVDAHAGGGGGIKFLSASDFNYDDGNTGSFNTVALWLLDDGFYFMPSNYTTVPVKGCLDGTQSARFNSDISGGGFYCFIKCGTSFWMFVNMSNQDAMLYSNRPLYFCKINRNNGWFSYEGNEQLAKRSELSA